MFPNSMFLLSTLSGKRSLHLKITALHLRYLSPHFFNCSKNHQSQFISKPMNIITYYTIHRRSIKGLTICIVRRNNQIPPAGPRFSKFNPAYFSKSRKQFVYQISPSTSPPHSTTKCFLNKTLCKCEPISHWLFPMQLTYSLAWA